MSEILEEERPQKRPVLLIVLGILSLVNIAWAIIGNFISLGRGPMGEDEMDEFRIQITKSINEIKNAGEMDWLEDFMRSIISMVESTNEHHNLSILTGFLILSIGLTAVIFMLRGRKLGFHLYIIYSLLASVQIYLFVSPSLLSNTIVFVSLFISGIFILLYGLNLKWMK